MLVVGIIIFVLGILTLILGAKIKVKRWYGAIGLLIGFIFICIITNEDHYEAGLENLRNKNYVEAVSCFEKIGQNHEHYNEKDSLIIASRKQVEKYYKEKITEEIKVLNKGNALKLWNKAQKAINKERLPNVENLLNKEVERVKNLITKAERAKDYDLAVREAQKLENVSEYKEFASDLILKYEELAKKAEIRKIRSTIISYTERGKYEEAKEQLKQLLSYEGQKEYIDEELQKINKKIEHQRWLKELARQRDDNSSNIAKQLISKNLRCPSTAKYVKFKKFDQKGRKYMMFVTLDAQNAFGAYLRSKYLVIFTYDKNSYEEFTYYPKNAVGKCSDSQYFDMYVDLFKSSNNW